SDRCCDGSDDWLFASDASKACDAGVLKTCSSGTVCDLVTLGGSNYYCTGSAWSAQTTAKGLACNTNGVCTADDGVCCGDDGVEDVVYDNVGAVYYCGCSSSNDGYSCENSNGNAGGVFNQQGICASADDVSYDCDVSGHVAYTSVYYDTECAGWESKWCDNSIVSGGNYGAEGACIDSACETSLVSCNCGVDGSCSGDVTDAKCSNACTASYACDADVGSNAFEQDGLCLTAGTCDASGHTCFDSGDSSYKSSCSVCGVTVGEANRCDTSVTDGDYVAGGVCTDADSCTTGALYDDEGTLKAGCSTGVAGDEDPCDTSAADGWVAGGICVSSSCDAVDVVLDTDFYANCDGHGGKQCDSAITAGDYSQDGLCFDDGGAVDGTNFDCETSGYVFYTGSLYNDDSAVATTDYDFDLDADGKGCDDSGDWSGGHVFTADGMVTTAGCTAVAGVVRVDASNNYYFVATCDASGDACDSSIIASSTAPWGRDGYCCDSGCQLDGSVANGGNCCGVDALCNDTTPSSCRAADNKCGYDNGQSCTTGDDCDSDLCVAGTCRADCNTPSDYCGSKCSADTANYDTSGMMCDTGCLTYGSASGNVNMQAGACNSGSDCCTDNCEESASHSKGCCATGETPPYSIGCTDPDAGVLNFTTSTTTQVLDYYCDISSGVDLYDTYDYADVCSGSYLAEYSCYSSNVTLTNQTCESWCGAGYSPGDTWCSSGQCYCNNDPALVGSITKLVENNSTTVFTVNVTDDDLIDEAVNLSLYSDASCTTMIGSAECTPITSGECNMTITYACTSLRERGVDLYYDLNDTSTESSNGCADALLTFNCDHCKNSVLETGFGEVVTDKGNDCPVEPWFNATSWTPSTPVRNETLTFTVNANVTDWNFATNISDVQAIIKYPDTSEWQRTSMVDVGTIDDYTHIYQKEFSIASDQTFGQYTIILNATSSDSLDSITDYNETSSQNAFNLINNTLDIVSVNFTKNFIEVNESINATLRIKNNGETVIKSDAAIIVSLNSDWSISNPNPSLSQEFLPGETHNLTVLVKPLSGGVSDIDPFITFNFTNTSYGGNIRVEAYPKYPNASMTLSSVKVDKSIGETNISVENKNRAGTPISAQTIIQVVQDVNGAETIAASKNLGTGENLSWLFKPNDYNLDCDAYFIKALTYYNEMSASHGKLIVVTGCFAE
ncbi:MAG: hypothetical protein GOU97_00995, partial [Nanoarchaeota archaeon]|nr:hypothetical protein [Nanoarchaeota archaeon]